LRNDLSQDNKKAHQSALFYEIWWPHLELN